MKRRLQGRVRKSDRSMAENILYRHPNGAGGLRRWKIEEIEEAYKIGYRWARVIVMACSAFITPDDDHRYGKRTRRAAEYARFIARVRDADVPERMQP